MLFRSEDVSLLVEYELARNDGSDEVGYLNAGARWVVAPQLKLSIFFKNVLQRGMDEPEPSRELAVVYTEEF